MSDHWRTDFASHAAFAPYAGWLAQMPTTAWPGLDVLNAWASQTGLCNGAGRPLVFVSQTEGCGQRDYEQCILTEGTVPTREHNWHDLFNALVWLTYPRTKTRLNAWQCQQLKAGERRSPASDAATLFDESGLLLVGENEKLVDLLRAHRWREALFDQRGAWSQLHARVIGHALLEKLLTPWPAITAHCIHLALPASTPPAEVDRALAAVWREGAVARPADLFPLPILGIPGWWPANTSASFYDDRSVFRPARRRA